MNTKKSVMLESASEQIMLKHTKSGDQIAWSNQVNQWIQLSDHLFRASLPLLEPSEWGTVLNAYANRDIPLSDTPYSLALDLMESQDCIDLTDHTDPDLVRKVNAMSQAEQFAILVFVDRYWCGEWPGMDAAEIIEAISGLTPEEREEDEE